jgi:hypothetical protein
MRAAADMLRRTGRMAAGALPAALMAKLGMPALDAVVFLAVMVLAVICWVIASGDRTDRVSQMMLAWRAVASCPASGIVAPPVPASAPDTALDAQAERLDRSVSRMRGLRRRARQGGRCPLEDRLPDTPERCLRGRAACGNAVSQDQSAQWSGGRGLNGTLPGWANSSATPGAPPLPTPLVPKRGQTSTPSRPSSWRLSPQSCAMAIESSRHRAVLEELTEWWEDLRDRGTGSRVVLVAVPRR